MNRQNDLKKAFTFLEIIITISIIGIFYSIFIFKFDSNESKLNIASEKLVLYLKQTRIQAMTNEKFDPKDNLWHKQRLSLKFLRCKESVSGLYYTIYSDTNNSGQIAEEESLKDPLTNKHIYSDNSCNYAQDRSKYVLLTKEFDIVDVKISCNTTTSLGQLSFGSDGKLYSQLSSKVNDAYEYLVTKPCKITLYNKKGDFSTILIEPNTGFVKNFKI